MPAVDQRRFHPVSRIQYHGQRVNRRRIAHRYPDGVQVCWPLVRSRCSKNRGEILKAAQRDRTRIIGDDARLVNAGEVKVPEVSAIGILLINGPAVYVVKVSIEVHEPVQPTPVTLMRVAVLAHGVQV